MDGLITGETDRLIGLSIIDNDDVEHVLDVSKSDGEITAHNQDGYPDKPANRTNEESEHIAQARRYARYHVYRERGHLTLEPRDIPEWQAIVAAVVARQATPEFIDSFGDYYQQFRSTVEADTEPVLEVPESEVAGLLAYLQQFTLECDLKQLLSGDVFQVVETALESDPNPDTLAAAVLSGLSNSVASPEAFSIGEVSEVGVRYQRATDVVTLEPDSVGNPADARLELVRVDSPWEEYHSPDAFHLLIAHHLLCQARDCYLQLGLEPPAGLRILGLGKFQQVVRNTHLEMYEMVHHTDADIDGYQLPDVGYEITL